MCKDIDQALMKARTDCARAGLRMTDKRCNVLKILLQADAPLSAYDMAANYKDNVGEPLSVMSAYRMLDFLMQAGLVHKLSTTNKYLACAHISCAHEHEIPQFLICDHCHSVTEVGLRRQLLRELKSSIENTGFVMASQQLELHGLCKNCRQQNKVDGR